MTDFTIYVDDQPFSVLEQYRKHGFASLPATPTMRGQHLSELVGGDGPLFLQMPWRSDLSRRIQPEQAVALTDGMRFFHAPSAKEADPRKWGIRQAASAPIADHVCVHCGNGVGVNHL